MTTDPSTKPSLDSARERFLNDLKQPNTQAAYTHGLTALLRFIDQTGYAGHTAGRPYPLSLLDDELLVAFYRWLNDHYTSPHTIQTYLAALQRFLVWLDAGDLLSPSCQLAKAQNRLKAAMGERGRRTYRHRRPDPELPRVVTYFDELLLPTPNDAETRRKQLEILRNRAIVHTLYASAGRVSEVAGLTREQVLDGRLDEVHLVGKGDKPRVILLTIEAMQAIRAYIKARADTYPALFISHSNRGRGQALTRQSIWRIVKQAARALDLHDSTSPHTFRHFRATQLLNEGMPLELVQAYLGHANIATTRQVYAHTRTAVLREQLDRFDQSPAEALEALEKRRGRE